MSEQTWTFKERPVEAWGPGPWQHEPDRIQWTSPTGFVCLALRTSLGAWCGYVGVPPAHPWHGHQGDDDAGGSAVVHGGLTFAVDCRPVHSEGHPMDRICHVAEDGQPDHLFWLGFDCAHAGDLTPGGGRYPRESYRDAPYVKAQCEELAAQAKIAT